MRTAIVTGVAGFIGSHIAESLLDKKFRVIGIDSFTDYYSKRIKKNNIRKCLRSKNFSFIEKDILRFDLSSLLKKGEYIFHEAAQPGVRSSWGKEFETYVKNNIIVTQRLLEFSKDNKKLKKIVIASSSSVYGNQSGKMIENSTITMPVSPYGTTKLAAENLAMLYHKNFGMPITALRYFTVYGPRQRPDMAFTKFITSAIKKEKITIYGNGKQTRDFTYISDVVNANISCISNDVSGKILNIGGGHIISINDILKEIKTITNQDLKISYLSKQPGDVERTEADIKNAKKFLKFQPKIKVRQGLIIQTEYIKNNLGLYNNS